MFVMVREVSVSFFFKEMWCILVLKKETPMPWRIGRGTDPARDELRQLRREFIVLSFFVPSCR
jgi:hypothetical protein